jgi:soluble lytic murein transglycosylase
MRALSASRQHVLRLERRVVLVLPLLLLTLVGLALLSDAWMRPQSELKNRVLGAAELWQIDPALAVDAVQNGLAFHVWRPSRASDALGRFERDALRPPPSTEPPFAITLRDAVREVFLTRSRLAPTAAVRVADAVLEEAVRFGYDPFLLLAVIEVESNFDPGAVSYRGARGLMQLMPDTRAWMLSREASISDELALHEADVRVGVRYLALLHRVFGRLDRALQAYNCGPGRLVEAMHDATRLPEETKGYAERVMKRFQRFKKDYAHLASKAPV